jgi:3-hydroxyacyl-CoA dehydrogenase
MLHPVSFTKPIRIHHVTLASELRRPMSNAPSTQPFLIRRAAVLGAGTMGSRIAAHLTNAGIPVVLLDLAGKEGAKPYAALALEGLAKSKPAAFFEAANAALITAGTFDDDLAKLSNCDLVVEAVTEDLAIKSALLKRVIPHLNPGALLTTNTSGIPVAKIAESVSAELGTFKSRFFGTHFFNPPRYMRLLEVIPTSETDPALLAAFSAFADRTLGKEVVQAHDTPNFIANRIGMATIFTTARLMFEQGLTLEEVDALTGSAIGWPRTGTFRLADMVGIDIMDHVASNFPAGVDANNPFAPLLKELINRKWLGDKTGQGFYKKTKGTGGDERFVLDLSNSDLTKLDYRPLKKASLPALEMAKTAATASERIKLILSNDPKKDKAAAFLWPLLSSLWNYSADRIGEVAADAVSIDRAMRAGFNWELGPFQMWDAAGVAESIEKMRALGLPISPMVEALLAAGHTSWYSADSKTIFSPTTGQLAPIPTPEGHARISDFKTPSANSRGILKKNPGASLVDIGNNIAVIELHSLKNAIGGDIISLINAALNPASDYVRDYAGFIIASDSDNFAVGANLMQVLMIAQEQDWDELELAIRAFQQMTALVKFCPRPVVVAPFGLTLGGGAEICLHAARRQPFAETYMGLVEAGVGLIPGGGGTKEFFLRSLDSAIALNPPDPRDPPSRFAQSAELLTALKRNFETIATAKASTSAAEAKALGLLAPTDRITLNRDRQLLDAKAQLLAIIESGYSTPIPRTNLPAPGIAALALLETGAYLMGQAGFASEHDQKVARWVAYILSGGRVTPGTLVSEQYLLDLECEAFLSLCGEPKTQERIAYTLKTGKPLRN